MAGMNDLFIAVYPPGITWITDFNTEYIIGPEGSQLCISAECINIRLPQKTGACFSQTPAKGTL
jgi:hypothetical protein